MTPCRRSRRDKIRLRVRASLDCIRGGVRRGGPQQAKRKVGGSAVVPGANLPIHETTHDMQILMLDQPSKGDEARRIRTIDPIMTNLSVRELLRGCRRF